MVTLPRFIQVPILFSQSEHIAQVKKKKLSLLLLVTSDLNWINAKMCLRTRTFSVPPRDFIAQLILNVFYKKILLQFFYLFFKTTKYSHPASKSSHTMQYVHGHSKYPLQPKIANQIYKKWYISTCFTALSSFFRKCGSHNI